MGEGFWIRSDTGEFFKIDEHARWVQVPENARRIGLSEEAVGRIGSISWDIDGPGRKAIVMEATAQGLIRFRDHGDHVTFEFQMPNEDVIHALRPFMEYYLGPASYCHLNNLANGDRWEGYFSDLAEN